MTTTVVLSPTTTDEKQPTTTISSNGVNSVDDKRQNTETITFDSCTGGLGIKIVGGLLDWEVSEKNYGIFVKKVLSGGLAAADGRLGPGDLILAVNGQSMAQVSNERAVTVLRKASASNFVQLSVCRDEAAMDEYQELMNTFSYSSSSSVCDRNSVSSRASTPSCQGSLNGWGTYTDEPVGQGHSRCTGESSCDSEPEGNTVPSGYQGPPQMSALRKNHLLVPSMASTPQTAIDGADARNRVMTPEGNTGLPQMSTMFVSQNISGIPGNASAEKLALDPNVKLKMEKLEMALRYLGLDPTLEQQAELRRRLPVGRDGSVTYGEFVGVARELFKIELQDCDLSPTMTYETTGRDMGDAVPCQEPQSELERVKQERDALRLETERLQLLLKQKENACNFAEEELLRVRRETQGALYSSRSLQSKLQLAEQAQLEARNMEHDYEEVVHALEVELTQLRIQLDSQLESPAVRKRLAVLACELRKAEASKKTYEVSTDKLIRFAETVHETLSGGGENLQMPAEPSPGRSARGIQPPGYLGRHKHPTPQTLSSEAKNIVMAVKSLIEVDPLPFGWDEAYTANGLKFYTNHVTQTTSWQHPVSKIQHGDTAHLPPPPLPPATNGNSSHDNSMSESHT
ncbi:Syntaxin-binding protein 4 [Lamellibrachia satsuma]|nr:Syntaxin-binding protein 4 [Lamellibrachia satsuma]